MRITSPSRRAAAVLAVSAIGMSTAVLSVSGVASAQITPETDYTFSTDPHADVTYAGVSKLPLFNGFCSVTWDLTGGSGGADSDHIAGDAGGHLAATTTIDLEKSYYLYPGTAGGNAEPESDGGSDDGYAGDGGVNLGGPDSGSAGVKYGTAGGTTFYGGGGGAASTVRNDAYLPPAKQGLAAGLSFDPLLSAFGGNGAGYDQGAGVGAGDGTNLYPAEATGVTENAAEAGDGVISGTVHLCAPHGGGGDTNQPGGDTNQPGGDTNQPGGGTGENTGGSGEDDGDSNEVPDVTDAPYVNWVQGDEGSVIFQLVRGYVADGDEITGVEYRLGKGDWAKVADVDNAGDYQYSGAIEGLTPGTTYSISFRFTTTSGHTEASEAQDATPLFGGPTNVVAVPGASFVKVSWQAPAGVPGITGYQAWAPVADAQSGNEPSSCTTSSADALSCVIGVAGGQAYDIVVVALRGDQEPTAGSVPVRTATVAGVAVSPTLPKASGVLTSDAKDGKAVAGGKVTISGKDFLPGSTVELVVYSTPVSLGSAVVGADGTFSQEVTLPKELANGTHHLVASGVDVNGDPRNLVVEVTISGGTAAAGDGTTLAYTGATVLPYVGGGLVALLAGGALVLVGRRRNA